MKQQMHLALVGKIGAGKTYIAGRLEQQGWVRRAFADPLKAMFVTMADRAIDKAADRDKLQRLGAAGRSPDWNGIARALEVDPAIRRSRQGQEAARLVNHVFGMPTTGEEFDVWWDVVRRTEAMLYPKEQQSRAAGFGEQDYWIDWMMWGLSSLPDSTAVVVDDCRFPNEAEALRALGFTIIKVDTPQDLRKLRVADRDGEYLTTWDADASETAQDTILADHIIEGYGDVEANIEALLRELRAQRKEAA